MQQPPVQYLDNSIHVLNIPDQNNAKLELYIFYTYPTAFVGSNVFSVLSKCGVKQNQYFQQVVNATQYFNCNFTLNKGYATTLEVYSKSGNFTEGVYFVEIGPSAYLKLKGINDMTAQFEIIVYSTDGLSEILKKPANLLQPPNTELYVNITIPPIAVIDPSNPPALDALTGQPFIPMGANFALNARLGGKVPRGTTLRYNWQFTKVESDSLGALDLMLRKNSSLPSNFVNTLQPMIQENSLGFSSIVLSQDKDMELQSLYKVSCFVTDLRNRILTKSSIYLRTPRDFYLRNLAQDPMSVFPKNASFTQLFRFSGQNIQYADFTSPSTVLYAYGYLDPLMVKSLTMDVLRNRFSEIPMSELMTVAVRVTDFSTNPIQYAYLPPSFRQVPGQAAPNITVDFDSIHYSYKHQLVMFVKMQINPLPKYFFYEMQCVYFQQISIQY
ncbi:hypothetical protein C9374_004092 [Naegleria lovaniensis]|uniref:Uncharacterized protein n=1 Tax=Naegleria lovaniensis TaxID=51637 RepID=A0AA88KP79_NAELO|nr:uncharacterized protein C9374_004092 [Naegleria lovaniensis]KAG2383421.1 hypothetical protein C9374_004092 [Naegleria lovaniensis]